MANTMRYNAFKTVDAYHFKVTGYGLRAAMKTPTLLVVRSINFYREWTLPTDANPEKMQVVREPGEIYVTVARFHRPTLQGGHVLRGTRIELDGEHVCVTFDKSTPECGKPCRNGRTVTHFIVSDNEVVVNWRYCRVSAPSKTSTFYAFDNDIIVEDDVVSVADVCEDCGSGWLDRHGMEHNY